MNVLFFLSRKRVNQRGLAPIYIRLSCEGYSSKLVSTGITILPEDWDGKKKDIRLNSNENKIKAIQLRAIKSRIDAMILFMYNKEIEISPENLKARLKKKPQRLAIDVCKEFNARHAKNIKASTAKHYKSKLKNFIIFLEEKKLSELKIKSIDVQLMQQFCEYLEDCGFKKSHVKKHVVYMKLMSKYAYNYKYVKRDDILHFSYKEGRVEEPKAHSQEQVKIFEDVVFERERLERIQDRYLFQCYTGISYCDLWEDFRASIKSIHGILCITDYRGKTGCPYTVPLVPKAQAILEKYNYKLPKLSNQRYNKYLKEAMAIAGIPDAEKVSTHTGRKTFAAWMDELGIPVDSISKMLGHSNTYTTLRHYLRISDKRIIRDFIRMNVFTITGTDTTKMIEMGVFSDLREAG